MSLEIAQIAALVGPIPKVGTGSNKGWSVDQVRSIVVPAITAKGCSLRTEILTHDVQIIDIDGKSPREHVAVTLRVWIRLPYPLPEMILGEAPGSATNPAEGGSASAIAFSEAFRDAVLAGCSISLKDSGPRREPTVPQAAKPKPAPDPKPKPKSAKVQFLAECGGDKDVAAALWERAKGDLSTARELLQAPYTEETP